MRPTSEAEERLDLVKDAVERVPTGVDSAICNPHSALKLAFTRAELLVILAVLSLLAVIVLPALAHDRARSSRIQCANNLRQIGIGFQVWGNDHDDTLPQEIPVTSGGTMRHLLAPNVWFHLAWISNEVSSPHIFLCPSDTGKPAQDFTGAPDKGYLNPNFANRATSYFLGYKGTDLYNDSDAPIAGDRNVSTTGISGCAWFNTGLAIATRPTSGAGSGGEWAPGLHGFAGNVLIWDGQVKQLDSVELRQTFLIPNSDNSVKHIIIPR